MILAGYLFGQLEALSHVDVTDARKVDAYCQLSKAVNDTAKNIIDLANASTKAAMLNSNVTGQMDVPRFFLEEV